MLVLPFQHSPQEFFATKIVTRFVFSPAQMFLHRGLGSDSRMIHSRQPKNFESLHPRAPGKNVLNRLVEHVSESKHPRNVRRWHDDRERWLRRFRVRHEIAIADPALIPFRFNRFRIVPLWKFSHPDESSETRAGLQTSDADRTSIFRIAPHPSSPFSAKGAAFIASLGPPPQDPYSKKTSAPKARLIEIALSALPCSCDSNSLGRWRLK